MWWDITKELISFAYKKQVTQQQQKERIAKVYERIAKLLLETAEELKMDVYPMGKCAAMEILANELVSCLEGSVEEDKLSDVGNMLHSCSKLEREYATRKSNDTIETLIKTAGQFEALSIIYSI